jgi:folate-binding protein YgfZ
MEGLASEAFPCLEEAYWEGLRMEYGRATWGKELEAGFLASEFRLGWAIHPSKGCYLGQEAIARTTFRTLPRKRLGAFLFEGALLSRGTVLWSQGEEVGQVLSSSMSPAFGSALAMARVGRAHTEPGQVLNTAEGRSLRAVELPLWKA